MSEFKHTPAPWVVSVGLDEHTSIVNITEGCITPVVETMAYVNREANAKLIAAAPDLLKAAIESRDLIKTISEGQGSDSISDFTVTVCEAVVCALEIIIDKATK